MQSLGLEREKSVTFGVHEILLLAACHRTWLVHAGPGYATTCHMRCGAKLFQKVIGFSTHPLEHAAANFHPKCMFFSIQAS